MVIPQNMDAYRNVLIGWMYWFQGVFCIYSIQVVERNSIMLEDSRNTVTMPSMIFLQVLSYLNRRRRSKFVYNIHYYHQSRCAVLVSF